MAAGRIRAGRFGGLVMYAVALSEKAGGGEVGVSEEPSDVGGGERELCWDCGAGASVDAQ